MIPQRKSILTTTGSRAGNAFIFLFLIAAAVITLFPIYMAVLNSLKSDGEMLNQVLAFPSSVSFANYADAYKKIDFLRSFVNTVVVTLIGVSGIIVFASMAGYKMSRTPGKLSRFLFSLFVLSSLIPFHSILITLVKIAKELKVQGTTYGLGFIYIGLGVALAIFLYHGFVKSIPRDLDEAAVMDGCGELRLYGRIIFPLLLPITATVAILNALWMWNDFLLPLLMLTKSDYYTLLISTNMLFGEYNNDWSAILASLVLTMLPIMAVYLVLQKYILSGIAEGAIKG
ncbi:carbohydrate ABC transporter permease [Paenibacillus sinopodophylli]|uniref:carbohydrate ABC transporter permease n=1 Tax=Paenibacillus sinopodophylli TaxID=1837342 RepID=UPI00110CF409|nr:carbohydrate ABC transporter permease [Paenibacillus sinopodophylli]